MVRRIGYTRRRHSDSLTQRIVENNICALSSMGRVSVPYSFKSFRLQLVGCPFLESVRICCPLALVHRLLWIGVLDVGPLWLHQGSVGLRHIRLKVRTRLLVL